ncbi:MAG: hypothetical protein WC262_11335 [Bacteroidales bacterium]|jgi:hypothetical protein
MTELVYTDEQLDAMSQEELKTEYERVIDILNSYWDSRFFYQNAREEAEYRYKIDRHYRRYGNLIGRVEGGAIEKVEKR